MDSFTPPVSRQKKSGQAAKNSFEKQLQNWHIKQKNGSPNHPQTQGKIERFHRTLKQWLNAQPRPETVKALNKQLAEFQDIYNTKRPHKGAGRRPPLKAYEALPKAIPQRLPQEEYRLRKDHVDKFGKITVRYAGRIRHFGMGVAHSGKEVRIFIDDRVATVIEKKTGEILATFTIDPTKDYQRRNSKPEQATT